MTNAMKKKESSAAAGRTKTTVESALNAKATTAGAQALHNGYTDRF